MEKIIFGDERKYPVAEHYRAFISLVNQHIKRLFLNIVKIVGDHELLRRSLVALAT